MANQKTIAIIGLGNPGKDYQKSRHNAGFMVVDAFATMHEPELSWEENKKLFSEVATNTAAGTKLLLVKPQTFMNLSGKSVSAIKNFYQIEPENIWVIHDDLDLPLGKAQIRKGGGLAGHHGLESITELLGTNDYCRVRVGIRGHELRSMHAEQGIDTNGFVVGDFTDRELSILNPMINDIVQALATIVQGGEVKSHMLTVAGYEAFTGSGDWFFLLFLILLFPIVSTPANLPSGAKTASIGDCMPLTATLREFAFESRIGGISVPKAIKFVAFNALQLAQPIKEKAEENWRLFRALYGEEFDRMPFLEQEKHRSEHWAAGALGWSPDDDLLLATWTPFARQFGIAVATPGRNEWVSRVVTFTDQFARPLVTASIRCLQIPHQPLEWEIDMFAIYLINEEGDSIDRPLFFVPSRRAVVLT